MTDGQIIQKDGLISSAMLSSFGSNSRGQLGIGSEEDQSIPTKTTGPPLKAVQVVGGSNHSLALCVDGQIYGCGDNSHNQLGLINQFYTEFVSLNNSGISVYCGWDCSYFIDKSGYPWSIGLNSYGVCGVGSVEKSIQQWTRVDLSFVTKISTGPRHTLFLTESGTLWGAGGTKQGMLGIQQSDIESSPVKITDDVVDCAAGQFHSIILKSDYSVFVFGRNKFGQFGANCELSSSFIPVRVPLPPDFEPKSIASSWSTCRVLSNDGRLLLWGRGDSGQLGKKISGRFSCEINEIEGRFRSHEFGSEHSLAVNVDGQLLTWGWNEHGNCGTGELNCVFMPTVIADAISIIGAGGGHSLYYKIESQ